jgi:streptogramin lyase
MRFDPVTGRRSRPLTRLGLNPRAVATGYGSVWVLGARRVLRIDPRTRRMVGHPIAIGRGARDIAAGEGAIWVTTGERRGPTGAALCDLVGIDPASSRVIRRQPIGCGAAALAVGSGSVWAASAGGRGIARVRPRGARLPLPGVQLPAESIDVAAGLGAVWVAGVRDIREGPYGDRSGRAVLSRLDAAGRRTGAALRLGPAHAWMPRVVAGAGAVWVANTPTGTITRIDPDDGAVSRLRVPVRR